MNDLAADIYAVTAVAADDRGAEASSEILVFEVGPSNPPPYIAITWPTDGAGFGAGVDLAIMGRGNHAPQGGAVTNVEFFVAAADAGGEATAPWVVTLPIHSP